MRTMQENQTRKGIGYLRGWRQGRTVQDLLQAGARRWALHQAFLRPYLPHKLHYAAAAARVGHAEVTFRFHVLPELQARVWDQWNTCSEVVEELEPLLAMKKEVEKKALENAEKRGLLQDERLSNDKFEYGDE